MIRNIINDIESIRKNKNVNKQVEFVVIQNDKGAVLPINYLVKRIRMILKILKKFFS